MGMRTLPAVLKNAYINILESGTVTLDAGTAHADYPLARLYDRGIGKVFKTTAAVATTVHIDQGASGNLAIDRLLIPSGHNLDGETLDIEWSDNDADWTPAVTQWTGAAGLINKSWDAITHRYWRFVISSTPAAAVQIAELFLTSTYTWERDPQKLDSGPHEPVFNVERRETSGGLDSFLVHGALKRQRTYVHPNCSEAQKDNILVLWAAWGGAKPFWLSDHDGTWIYGRLRRGLGLRQVWAGRWKFVFDFFEVVG